MENMKVKTKNHFQKRYNQFKKFIKRVWEILRTHEMAILPGQLAFFLILSIVPILTLIGYGASYFNISIDFVISNLKTVFNENIISLLVPIIEGDSLDFKLVIMFLIMFYIASKGPSSIIVTANEIYGIKQSSWIKRRIKALIITIILVLLFLFIILVPVLGTKIINAFNLLHIKTIITSILSIMQGPISWLIIFIFIKTIFTLAPDKHIPSRRINIGAVFTTLGWVIITKIYGYYISNFARYNLYYSGLSNLAVLMLWIYFLSYIFVIGLSLTIDSDELEKTGSIEIKN